MNKILLTILLFAFSASTTFAQRGGRGDRDDRKKFEEIQTIKIGYITKKLNLTSSQAKEFWPVYNEYEKKRMELHRKFIDQYRAKNPNGNRQDARAYIDADISYQEQKLELRKTYTAQLKGIISDQQIADLFIAEQEFKQMLLKRLRDHRPGGAPQGTKQ